MSENKLKKKQEKETLKFQTLVKWKLLAKKAKIKKKKILPNK